MLSIKDSRSQKLEKALNQQLESDLSAPVNEDELFVLAEYDETAAEKGGYSNYSYWRSTLRTFFKSRINIFAEILFTDLFIKACLFHNRFGLLVNV